MASSGEDIATKSEQEESLSELEGEVNASDQHQVKRIKKKIDLRICVVLGVLYTASLVDRVNLPNAYVAGMDTDLDLKGNAYVKVILHRRTKITLLTCSSAEVAKRNAAFYLLGSFIAGFGGILAYGLSRMKGVGGHAGWRWIFILEGTITVAFGLVAYFLIVDFPEDAHKSWKFLKEDEIQTVIDRINRDRQDVVTSPFKLGSYLKNALDWKIWFYAANFGLTSVVTYASAYFLPIVLQEGLGFSEAASECLSTPCYVVGSILGFGESLISDRIGLRTPFLLFNCVIEVIGVVVLGFAKPSGVRYFGAFLIIAGSNSNIPLCLTYQANNIRGVWRRAFCSATIVGAGGIGGIIGSLTFRAQDAPTYRPGLYTCITAGCLTFLSVCTTTTYFFVQNKKQKQGKTVIEGLEGFRYTY
ncbi:retrograde regulation protein 2 [Penicillium riverlandense]|uniref:retrograde regulation protein 2 n=1 Tax=Penicillium riverlandense TaxID=1903569 RepID=UPI00254772DA|nr:retrograde regulation protein 2 [Penicillium riverlandense]KAJ5819273.1 retrograde regulation protein 2 [Penicillium riverlandense]